MNPAMIEIHEFSTGIRPERTFDGGWVSRGFTGVYMNMTLQSIPSVVEGSIANRFFALTEGASGDEPAIIGRVVGSPNNSWSVMAVVTRGKDEQQRSMSVYRYFLCQGANNLWQILAWWINNGMSRFNPFDIRTVGQPNLFNVNSSQPPDIQQEALALPMNLSKPILLNPQQYDLQTINILALRKFNIQNNGQQVSWAFNVQALEKPRQFQVIQPANQRAYEILERVINNSVSPQPDPWLYNQNENNSTFQQLVSDPDGEDDNNQNRIIDEETLKSTIRGLINSSRVKREAVQTITDALQIKQISTYYWHSLFDGQGAETAISQKIYNPQMLRLITLRAMVIPETLPEFLDWLNIKGDKKPDENQKISLDFQKAIDDLNIFPQEKLASGFKYILSKLLSEEITPEAVHWLLKYSAWAACRKKFINDIVTDLQLIENYFKSPEYNSSQGQSSLYRDNFQCGYELWQDLIKYWKSMSSNNKYRLPGYKSLAELFKHLSEYRLSAYFYQVSEGIVTKDIFKKAAYSANLRGNTIVFLGLKLHCQFTYIDRIINLIKNQQEHLLILTGVILIITIFIKILTKLPINWDNLISPLNNLDGGSSPITTSPIPNLSDNKNTFQPITKEKKEIALNRFETTTKIAINQLVAQLTKEQLQKKINTEKIQSPSNQEIENIQIEIIVEIKKILRNFVTYNNLELDYTGAFKNNNKSNREVWIEAIYNYQKSKNKKNAYGFIDAPGAQSGAQTYKDLKKDIEDNLKQKYEQQKQ